MRISPLRERYVYRESDGTAVSSNEGGLARRRRREGHDPTRSGGGSVSSVRSSDDDDDDDDDHGDDDRHHNDDDDDENGDGDDGDLGGDDADDGADDAHEYDDDDALYRSDDLVRYSDVSQNEATYKTREHTERHKRDSHHQHTSVHRPHRTPSPHARSPPSHVKQPRAAKQMSSGGNRSSQVKPSSSSDRVAVKQLRKRTTSRNNKAHEAMSDTQSDEDQDHPYGKGETNVITLKLLLLEFECTFPRSHQSYSLSSTHHTVRTHADKTHSSFLFCSTDDTIPPIARRDSHGVDGRRSRSMRTGSVEIRAARAAGSKLPVLRW